MKPTIIAPKRPADEIDLPVSGFPREPHDVPHSSPGGLAASGTSPIAHPPHARPLDGHSFAIGILAVTASILFVGLILVLNSPAPALAAGMNDRGGDYIMVTQQLSESVEGLLVVDAASKVGILYGYDYNQKKIDRLAPNLRLDRLPTPNNPKGEKAGAKKKPGG